MSRLTLPAGVTLAHGRRRLTLPAYGVPERGQGNAVAALSSPPTATATANAVPHAEGLWTDIITAVSEDVAGITVLIGTTTTSGVDTSTLLDIGVDPTGGTTFAVAIPDIGVGYKPAAPPPVMSSIGTFPLFIPKGARVAVRCQSVTTLKAVPVGVVTYGVGDGRRPPATVDTFGANAATSQGAIVTLPGAVNAKGAWVELAAAGVTTQPYSAFLLSAQGGSDVAMANGSGLVDIGIGAAAAESVLIADIPILGTSSEILSAPVPGPWAVPGGSIPAGTRLAVRWATSTLSNTLDVCLHAIRR